MEAAQLLYGQLDLPELCMGGVELEFPQVTSRTRVEKGGTYRFEGSEESKIVPA